jgi:2-polyprenyl-3-methyl-5-hydroxy-6-metoxy-1,4-benzoquinol methylase
MFIKRILKAFLYGPARWLGICFSAVPSGFVAFIVVNIVRVLSISRSPVKGIHLSLTIEKALYGLTTEAACRYNNGVHTKHRHTGYHDFFCSRLKKGEKVLDIGSGNGFLSYDMAEKAGAIVTGIELSEKNHRIALEKYSHYQVKFINDDVLTYLPDVSFNTIVMSNVLEHIENRVTFIIDVQKKIQPDRWLFRVPIYERDWRVPLMEEVGMDYRLDGTHFIEYTQEKFIDEVQNAGLNIDHLEIRWSEIWCEASS